MKLILVLVCITAGGVVVSANIVDSIAKVVQLPTERVQECYNQSGITDDEIAKLDRLLEDLQAENQSGEKKSKQGKNSEDRLSEDEMKLLSGKVGCAMACIGRKMGVIVDNEFRTEEIHDFINESSDRKNNTEVHEAVDECVVEARKEENECKAALQFVICATEALSSDESE